MSGEWILIAPGRLRRPDQFIRKRTHRRVVPSVRTCPFENPLKNVSDHVLLRYDARCAPWGSKSGVRARKNCEILVLQNRYPAVGHADRRVRLVRNGPFSTIPGAGHHDLVLTRDHRANFPRLPSDLAFRLFEVFRERYLMFFADPNVAYVSIFHNWGPLAGASIYHPHYQILGVPVVPPDVGRSLEGSTRYHARTGKCIHCVMTEWERKQGKRVIVENEGAIAFAPFVSRNPFEVRVFSKHHTPYFENTSDEDLAAVTNVLQRVLRKMEKNLGDPDYNFFIHTAPVVHKERYPQYHWHVEILPKLSTRAGFEFGTGIEINVIDPDLAAKVLRK